MNIESQNNLNLVTEAKEGAYSDEHAHARIWNHMTGLGIAHDKEAMVKELEKAKTDKKHALHFDNAKDEDGFVGGKKTAAHKTAYHAEHENAIHSIHALATHPDFKAAIKNGHRASVTGGGKGEVTPLWEQYGATKGATSKTDIAIMHPNKGTGEGIRISLKKGGGSQLMSSGPEEHNAVFHAAADEMLATHPKYKKLSRGKKAKLHAEIMSKVKKAGKIADMARGATESEMGDLVKKSQRIMNSLLDDHPDLNTFARKEAATGRGKFGEKSPYAASYIVKSSEGKRGVEVKDVDDMDFSGPRIRVAKPKGTGRSLNFKFDERATKMVSEEINNIFEATMSKAEKAAAAMQRMFATTQTVSKGRQRDNERAAAEAEARQENEIRKAKTANREAMSARKEARAQQSDTDLRWADYENKVMRGVTGRGAVSQFAKGANLEAPNQFKLEEEAPANAMGTAGISGLDTAVNVGIAGRDMLLTPEILRRPPPKMFGGKRVFTVPSKDYYKATLGRRKGQHWRSMVNGPLGEEIRQYALENKEAPIIVEDETTGAMMYLRYGKR